MLPSGGPIAVYNADIMSSINLQSLAKLCPEQGCCLALVENPNHNANGDFSLRGKHVTTAHDHTYTFSGVSVWSEDALTKYPCNTSFPLITSIRELIAKKVCLGSIYRGQWFDIGRPRDLIQANRLFYHEAL
jgi:MurNAc alpha-1-phosphate uridylyltransferase